MKIVFDEEDTKVLAVVARNHNIATDRLLASYKDIMARELLNDLSDIARENEEELKGEPNE